MRRGCVLGTVSMILLLACSSEDRPPLQGGTAGGGTVSSGSSRDGGEPTRSDAAAEASSPLPRGDGGTCACGGCTLFTGKISVTIECGFSICEDGVLHACGSLCEISIDKC
ncbi:MAG: hypothetical protein HOO96_34800 [Polyangiaceae bacterium]|nr:hypothetical protein [Polyangiaceae bacterium]